MDGRKKRKLSPFARCDQRAIMIFDISRVKVHPPTVASVETSLTYINEYWRQSTETESGWVDVMFSWLWPRISLCRFVFSNYPLLNCCYHIWPLRTFETLEYINSVKLNSYWTLNEPFKILWTFDSLTLKPFWRVKEWRGLPIWILCLWLILDFLSQFYPNPSPAKMFNFH